MNNGDYSSYIKNAVCEAEKMQYQGFTIRLVMSFTLKIISERLKNKCTISFLYTR